MVISTKNDAFSNLSLSMNNQLTPNLGNSCMKPYFSNEISLFCQSVMALLSCAIFSRYPTICALLATLSGLTKPTFRNHRSTFLQACMFPMILLSVWPHSVELTQARRQERLLTSIQNCCLQPLLAARIHMFHLVRAIFIYLFHSYLFFACCCVFCPSLIFRASLKLSVKSLLGGY